MHGADLREAFLDGIDFEGMSEDERLNLRKVLIRNLYGKSPEQTEIDFHRRGGVSMEIATDAAIESLQNAEVIDGKKKTKVKDYIEKIRSKGRNPDLFETPVKLTLTIGELQNIEKCLEYLVEYSESDEKLRRYQGAARAYKNSGRKDVSRNKSLQELGLRKGPGRNTEYDKLSMLYEYIVLINGSVDFSIFKKSRAELSSTDLLSIISAADNPDAPKVSKPLGKWEAIELLHGRHNVVGTSGACYELLKRAKRDLIARKKAKGRPYHHLQKILPSDNSNK